MPWFMDMPEGRASLLRAEQPGNVSLSFRVAGHGDAAPGMDGRIGMDLAPTDGILPSVHALTEYTFYATVDQSINFSRMNLSAMADGTYRFGQEVGGNQVHRPILWSMDGYPYRAAGTQVYLMVDPVRAGQSQPIAIQNGHLRFDIQERGGNYWDHYIGRGGGNTLTYNVPPDGAHVFLVGNRAVGWIDAAGYHAAV